MTDWLDDLIDDLSPEEELTIRASVQLGISIADIAELSTQLVESIFREIVARLDNRRGSLNI